MVWEQLVSDSGQFVLPLFFFACLWLTGVGAWGADKHICTLYIPLHAGWWVLALDVTVLGVWQAVLGRLGPLLLSCAGMA